MRFEHGQIGQTGQTGPITCQGSGTGGAEHTAGERGGRPDDRREYIGLICDRGYDTLANTNTKASLLKDRFFPPKSNTVNIEQAAINDPPPLQTRSWVPITSEEIHAALKDTSNKSTPGPSGVNYKLLKWVFDACPDAMTHLFNLSLSTGTHVWKHVTIVPVPKPNKPDYSAPKAYRPVSLMECPGKLLEKVITKRITDDISLYPDILPNNQFGSRP